MTHVCHTLDAFGSNEPLLPVVEWLAGQWLRQRLEERVVELHLMLKKAANKV